VELIDLFPTACELTGLKTPATVQGKSLVPVLHDPKKKIKKSALSFVKGGTSMRTEKWSYMKYRDGSEELYDMKKDLGQYRNLTGIQSFSNDLKSTRKLFSREIKSIRN
jgi:iduronate 2-sulfatase